METASNVHPAVRLMLARMDSNPEEFRPRGFRWEVLLRAMLDASSAEERVLLTAAINRFSMDDVHEKIMSELLKGSSPPPASPGFGIPRRSPSESKLIQEALKEYKAAAGNTGPAGMASALKGMFK